MSRNPEKLAVVMPEIRLITVSDVYANLRTRMKGIVANQTSTPAARQSAVRILNIPRDKIVSTGEFGTPCSACHAVSLQVAAFNNEYALCDSCLTLAAQIMAGGENRASSHAGPARPR